MVWGQLVDFSSVCCFLAAFHSLSGNFLSQALCTLLGDVFLRVIVQAEVSGC
jgi:hypothetical protein